MKKVRIVLFLVLGLFVLSGWVQAADEEESEAKEPEPVIMGEVVVTASRYEEEISSVPANVTVITKEDIANSTAQDIPSILRTQVGIQVTDVTGNRRSYKVDLRGFGETAQSNTLVLVDGRRVNQADLGGTDWSLIHLDRVQRIEIIRGSSGSILYGDNATGGVINIITKEGDQLAAGVDAAGGSYDTLKTSAYVSGTQNDLSYALSGRYYQSDGYRDNSDTKATDLGLNLGYFLGDTAKVSFATGYHKDDTGVPGGLKFSDFAAGADRTDTTNPLDFADTEDFYFELNPEIFFFQNSLFQIPLSYRNRDQLFFNSFSIGEFRGNTHIKTIIASPQLVIKESIAGYNNNLTFGFDYVNAQEDILNQSIFFGTPTTGDFKLEKINYSFYIHDEFYPIKKLALSAGLRYDKAEFTFTPSTPSETDFDESPITAGISYNYHKDSYAYFNYAQSFRYPLLDELYDFFTNTINANLIPQTSDDIEIGIRHYFTKNFHLNLNIFRLETQSEIFFNPFTFVNDNFDGTTRRDGIEISIGKTFEKVFLIGTYTYTNAEVTGGQFAGNTVPGVPEHMATFDSVIDLGTGLTFTFNGKYIGERFFESDYANAFPEQDDFIVFNAKLKYVWWKFTAYLDVNNLFNEKYSEFGVLSLGVPVEPAVFPSPERNFLLGLRFDY
jgi:iron complex outermembrane receptor protein